MASAQILQLYYTKDHKSQQGNQSKYHHQRSKPLLQGRQSITIPRKQYQALPQNHNTFSKLTEHFYCFQQAPTPSSDNKSKSEPKENIRDPWHQLQHHKSLFTNNNIEKCVPRTTRTTKTKTSTSQHQSAAVSVSVSVSSEDEDEYDSNKDDDDDGDEKDITTTTTGTGTGKDHIPREKTCSWWRDTFNFRKDENPTPEDDATPAAIAADALDDCEGSLVAYSATPRPCLHHQHQQQHQHQHHHQHHHYQGCPFFSTSASASAKSRDAGGAATKATTLQQYNHMVAHNGRENNHFQYKVCSPLPSQPPPSLSTSSSPSFSSSKFSNDYAADEDDEDDDIGNSNNEFAAQQTSSMPQRIDTFITGSYKQCRGDWSAGAAASLSMEEGRQLYDDGESATDCVNFIATRDDDDEGGENENYAMQTTRTATTTTTTKTKNCATCCQNNATSSSNTNTSVDVAAGVDKTCFLQKRIDFYRNENDSLTKATADCLILCKFKPTTCQKSQSPGCCEQYCSSVASATLLDRYEKRNWNDDNTNYNNKRLQSSNSSNNDDSLSSLLQLQSTTSGSTTTTTTLSRLSSKKQCCCNTERRCTTESGQLQQHQLHKQQQQQQHHHRQQRTTKFDDDFDCQRKWPPCNNTNTNYNTNRNNNNKSRLFSATATATATSQSQPIRYDADARKFYRRLSENAINAFADVQRFTRAILPLIIIFNILPLLYAVASNFDATELKGGPYPDPNPWIPVVAYLEPLSRPTKSPKCDQTFVSRVGGPQNGTFSAPLIHNPRNHSRQCLYIFLAGPGQRVEVVFTTFNLRGSPPDGSAVGELPTCVHEYMDIYSEVQSSDPADLINSPFGGRFCGTIPPRRRISMHRAIAISFFTNKNVSEPDLFEGRYRFLNASEYEIGIPIAGSPCSYTITPSMSINKTGALISPTYPGAYPKDMSCTYQFLGETNQRVRLEFRDFDLFFGGPHCPFDYVKVYDGPDNSSALIGTYCGQQRNLVLYSSESSLFVHFYTLPRTANTQNRGFKGIYEFSESFVKLDFIRENDGIHIRGSECDQKILSKKESTGFVLSPNYPYPYIPKTVCRYFIYGMQDAQHLERVRLEFSAFNIPKVEHKDKGETNCSDGYLKIYLKGQETADAYDKFDYELCGNETQRVVSDGPRLAMVFSSGELQGRGFKGKYTFETEYKIPGTAAPDGTCSFTYVSSSKKRGELNSPRYPSNYPSETNCSYLFLAEPNEQVTIVFDHFKVKADNVNSTAGAYGASACFEDWLEMYVIYRDNNDRFLGRYCGLTAPGPVESPRGAVGLRITLHTDQENVASGFKARYYFETAKSEVGDCGGNFSNEDSGIITSPHYPSNYKSPAKGMASMACNWYMTARTGYKLSINFEHFSVEGDPMARGCPAAVLRMWTNVDSEAAPIELCGEKPPTEHWHYISTGQSARISFTTTDKTIGAQGFRIVWTEIQDSGPGPPAIGLLCESTYHFQCNVGYCISDKLRCDGVKNCGPGDDSDEMHCITEAPKEDHGVLIIISMAAVSFLICLLCTLCHRQKKRRHRQLGLHRNTGHYDSTTSATGLSSSRRHLQGGGSLSGSLHGINSGTLIIPPAPLPPTSVPPPPHICIAGTGAAGSLSMGGIGSGMMIGAGLDDDDDNDDDEDNPDIFINDIRFDENNLDQLETV